LVADIRDGRLDVDAAVARLSRLPFAEVGDALVDHHRHLRQGLPEVVYGPGKSPGHCVTIVGELLEHGTGPVLVTRANQDQKAALVDAHPDVIERGGVLGWRLPPTRDHGVLVAAAGTADVPVLEECCATLTAFGIDADRLVDIGVAGLHRLLANVDRITTARAVVVVAGMEGALASVVGGLTSVPVIAVPTSVGYGAGLEGVTALLAMLSSCASGVTVVGIDNGFGAACAVARLVNTPRDTA
jgi:NCAIR mutase (PurE)-related protein